MMTTTPNLQLSQNRIEELGYCFAEFALSKTLIGNDLMDENKLLSDFDESYKYFLNHVDETEMLREGEREILNANFNDLDIQIELEAIKAAQNIMVEVGN